MTTSRSTEVEKRTTSRRAPISIAGALAALCAARAEQAEITDERPVWARYPNDPVGFAEHVIGVTLTPDQRAIVEATRDNLRVAVRSGHKVGKSLTCAVIALWFYCSFPGARVIITAATDRQVNGIIWREIKRFVKRAPIAIPGADSIGELARTGIRSSDFSEIVGFTAKESEAMAGISGAHLLYLVDEASGVSDSIFEAIEGNRAAGARLVMISNPTRCDGEFFEAFHAKSRFYKCFHVSSRSVIGMRIPGLASADWITEKEEEWGIDSLLFKVRVEGEFPINEERKAISLALLEAALARWAETKAEGRLCIGLDPAGPGDGGDETAFALRRGLKIFRVVSFTSLTPEGILAHLRGLIREHGDPDPRRATPPLVVLDATGPIGYDVLGILRAHLTHHPREFEVARVKSSDKAVRQPSIYDRMRDELWANCALWLRDGGAIPADAKLEKDLHTPEFASDGYGRLKATDKPTLRKLLGRSPDRGDAVTLAVWEPLSARAQEPPPAEHEEHANTSNPYDALNVWRARR